MYPGLGWCTPWEGKLRAYPTPKIQSQPPFTGRGLWNGTGDFPLSPVEQLSTYSPLSPFVSFPRPAPSSPSIPAWGPPASILCCLRIFRNWHEVWAQLDPHPFPLLLEEEMGNFRSAKGMQVERVGDPQIGLGTRWQLAPPLPLFAPILVKKKHLEIVHG